MISIDIGGYAARFREPLPPGLTKDQLIEAVIRTQMPLADRAEDEPGPYLEDRLPTALREVTGHEYHVHYHHETIEHDAPGSMLIVGAQFTLEAT